MIGGSNSRRG